MKHPLVTFTLGSITQREQLISHPEIESLLYVQKGKLYQLFLPRVVQEFDLDTESSTSKVAGVVGKNIDKYSVVSFTRKEILGDFWTYVNESASTYFHGGQILNEDVFTMKTVPSDLGSDDIVSIDQTDLADESQPDYPCTPAVIIGCVPFCIPKLRGADIVTGPLTNDQVMDSLKQYHEGAMQWIQAVKKHKKALQKLDMKTLSKEYHPTDLKSKTLTLKESMVVATIEDDDTQVLKSVENDITLIKSVSEKHTKRVDSSSYSTPIRHRSEFQLSQCPDSASIASAPPTPLAVVKEKNVRTIAFYKIFFSAKVFNAETNKPDLHLGSISEDFTEALEASSKSESIMKFKTALDTRLIEKAKSDSYLDRNIELPNLNDTLVALIINCMFHKHLLDQNMDLLNKRVSVLNFLAKPEHGQSHEEYKKYIARNNASEMEGVVDEAIEKRLAKDKTVFTKGRQDTLPDITAALANLIFVLEFLCDPIDCAETPGILTMLHKLAKKVTDPEFKEFYNYNKSEMPWIPYSILCHIQSILKAHAIAASDVHTLRHVENDATPDPRVLTLANSQFDYIINNYDLCISTNNPGFFASKPLGYAAKRKADRDHNSINQPKRERSNNDSATNAAKKGWLVTTGDIKFPDLKHSKKPCLFFIIEGKYCRRKPSECSYDHKTYPRGFKKEDQATICKWVKETPAVTFASIIPEKDRNVTWTPMAPAKSNENENEGKKNNDVSDPNADKDKDSTNE